MLTYIVNTLFANNKLELSLEYADILKYAMEEYNRLLYDKYIFFYYNALVLNFSVTNIDKGIELLEEIKGNESLKNTPFYEVFVYLNLAIFWFKKQDFHQSIKELNKLFQHESYNTADETLKFKIAIAELIIRYELKDYEFLEYRIEQMKKDYRDLLKKEENGREKEFIGLLTKMIKFQDMKFTIPLKKTIREFIRTDDNDGKDDAEVINYSNWLKGKIKHDKGKSFEEEFDIPEN
jgi:tetratricopeptide (TPR) repeat protein